MSLYRLYFEDNKTTVPCKAGDRVVVIRDVRFRSAHKDPHITKQSQSALRDNINVLFTSTIDTVTVDVAVVHSPGPLPVRSTWTLTHCKDHITIDVVMVDELFTPDSTMVVVKPNLL